MTKNKPKTGVKPYIKGGRETSENEYRTRRNVMMSESTVKLLKDIGSGNISEGIRLSAVMADTMKRMGLQNA